MLIAICSAQLEPSFEVEDGNLGINIASGNSFSIRCPKECPEIPEVVACSGSTVEIDGSQCRAKESLVTQSEFDSRVSDLSSSTYTKAEVDAIVSKSVSDALLDILPNISSSQKQEIEEASPYWVLWSHPQAILDDSSIPAKSSIGSILTINGFHLEKYYLSNAHKTIQCDFENTATSQTVATTYGTVTTADGGYVVSCPSPDVIGTIKVTVSYIARAGEAVVIPFDGRAGWDEVVYMSEWTSVKSSIAAGLLSLTVDGLGFDSSETYTCIMTTSFGDITLTGLADGTKRVGCSTQIAQVYPGTVVTGTVRITDSSGREVHFEGLTEFSQAQFSTCEDGFKGGDETDVDCGGSCKPCGGGKTCATDSDCAVSVCAATQKCTQSCNTLLTDAKARGLPLESKAYELVGIDGTVYNAYCDMEAQGGGWTLVSKLFAVDGSPAPASIAPVFNDNSKMWTKGGGDLLPAPVELEQTGNDMYVASSDWRNVMRKDKKYRLRQTVWKGRKGDEKIDVTDVDYSFVYPGWVTQDDAPAGNPTWTLGGVSVGQVVGNVDAGGTMQFYPPYARNDRTIVNGCGAYSSGSGDGYCREAFYFGSAGIVQSNPANGRDGYGVPWVPHAPLNIACHFWGFHQEPQVYCADGPTNGAYWLREDF